MGNMRDIQQINKVVRQRSEDAESTIAQLKLHAATVLKNYPVEAAYLYGSVARKRPLPVSDIDIALLLHDEALSSYERLLLETEIQAALEDASRLSNIDVRTINDAPITVQGTVVQEGILLYNRNKEQRVAFEVAVRKRYFDYLPTMKRMQRAFLEHIQKKGLSHGQPKNYHVDREQRHEC
jgi:uncharacterized protein